MSICNSCGNYINIDNYGKEGSCRECVIDQQERKDIEKMTDDIAEEELEQYVDEILTVMYGDKDDEF